MKPLKVNCKIDLFPVICINYNYVFCGSVVLMGLMVQCGMACKLRVVGEFEKPTKCAVDILDNSTLPQPNQSCGSLLS